MRANRRVDFPAVPRHPGVFGEEVEHLEQRHMVLMRLFNPEPFDPEDRDRGDVLLRGLRKAKPH